MNEISHNKPPASSTLQTDYILLDSSSSMGDKWLESILAIDSYVQGVKAANIKSQVILHMLYDQNSDYIHRDLPIDQWTPLIAAVPQPVGLTPLYDAINLMGIRLRDLDPPRCSILIVTDGEDSGRGTSLPQARAVLDWLRAKGYQITFIGADFSNSRQSRALGANPQNALGVSKALLSDATAALAKKRQAYGLYGTPMDYTDSEQSQFGGYLAPSPAEKA